MTNTNCKIAALNNQSNNWLAKRDEARTGTKFNKNVKE